MELLGMVVLCFQMLKGPSPLKQTIGTLNLEGKKIPWQGFVLGPSSSSRHGT